MEKNNNCSKRKRCNEMKTITLQNVYKENKTKLSLWCFWFISLKFYRFLYLFFFSPSFSLLFPKVYVFFFFFFEVRFTILSLQFYTACVLCSCVCVCVFVIFTFSGRINYLASLLFTMKRKLYHFFFLSCG